MGGDARPTTLGETVELLMGFPFSSARFTDDPKAMRLLRGDNVAQGHIRWEGVKKWAASDGLSGFLLRPGDVILAMDRPWIEAGLKHATLTDADCPSLLVQRVACLRARPGLDQRFLGYVIRARDFTEYVLGVQTGTAVPHISGGQIRDYEFQLPPLPAQRAAAELLGTLDDKIELNRRMAKTLEATARALFKSWFVDFDPVRAKTEGRPAGLPDDLAQLFPDALGDDRLPLGWTREPMLEHARLISGGTPKTDEAMFWDGSIPWASAKDVSQCASLFLTSTERTITQLGLDKSATKIVPKLSIVVVARGATTGRRCMLGGDMTINQTCYALSSVQGVPYWLSCAVDHCMDEIVQGGHGSVFNTITTSNIRIAKLTIANPKVTARFESFVAPFFERILGLIEDAATLAALRDKLLPKLISGELRIRDAEHAAAAA